VLFAVGIVESYLAAVWYLGDIRRAVAPSAPSQRRPRTTRG
jgi:hypothetical protein